MEETILSIDSIIEDINNSLKPMNIVIHNATLIEATVFVDKTVQLDIIARIMVDDEDGAFVLTYEEKNDVGKYTLRIKKKMISDEIPSHSLLRQITG